MAKEKAKKILGVLARQRPERRRKPKRLRLFARLAGVALLLTIVVGGYSLAKNGKFSTAAIFSSRKFATKSGGKAIDWNVVVRPADGKALPADKIDDVIALVKGRLSTASNRELREVAKALVQKTSLGSVSLTRSGKNQIIVSTTQRVPALVIQADQLRYVASDGTVFGDGVVNTDDFPALPIVSGIFTNRSEAFSLNENGTVILNGEEQGLLKESVQLSLALKAGGWTATQLDYKRFRGFFATIQKPELEVAFGRAPFSRKVERLREIVNKLEKSGSMATRIELDYQGKAFIKEKKL